MGGEASRGVREAGVRHATADRGLQAEVGSGLVGVPDPVAQFLYNLLVAPVWRDDR